MILISTERRVYRLLTVMSVTGEYPFRSLPLLGPEYTMRRVVRDLCKPQVYHVTGEDGEAVRLTLDEPALQIVGRGQSKSIRLTTAGLRLLAAIDPDGYDNFMILYKDNHLQTDVPHIDRNHRIAEVVAMCYAAGIECHPTRLPILQTEVRNKVIPDTGAVMYTSRLIKEICADSLDRTEYSRQTGLLFCGGKRALVLYNTRRSVMRWGGIGELKTLMDIKRIAQLNAEIEPESVDTAILFGAPETDIATLESWKKGTGNDYRFDSVFWNVCFVPLSEFGTKLLKLLSVPDWKERFLGMLFSGKDGFERVAPEQASVFDGYKGNVRRTILIDGNLARICRIANSIITDQTHQYELICCTEQVATIHAVFGDCNAKIKRVNIDNILIRLGIG